MLVVNPRGFLERGRANLLCRIGCAYPVQETAGRAHFYKNAGLRLWGKTNLYRKASALKVHVFMVIGDGRSREKTRSQWGLGWVREGRYGAEGTKDTRYPTDQRTSTARLLSFYSNRRPTQVLTNTYTACSRGVTELWGMTDGHHPARTP